MKNEIVDEFDLNLANEGKAKATISSYTGDVRLFLEWLETKDVVFNGELQRLFIKQYKEYLLKENYAIDTFNKKINSLTCFNQFLLEAGYIKNTVVYSNKDKIKIARGSNSQVEVYSAKELEKILFYIEDKKNVSIRNKLIIYLLLYTGIRVSEIINIKISDIDFLTQQLKIIGKGGKLREVPIKTELLSLVEEYMKTERRDSKYNGSDFLLVSQRAGKLHRDTINKVLSKIGSKLKIHMYPHKYRHTFCSMLIEKGVNIATVSELAGHSSIDMTMSFYVNISKESKTQAVTLL